MVRSVDSLRDLSAETLLRELIDLILCHSNSKILHLADHFLTDLHPRYLNERSEMRKADALSAILVAGNLGNDLGSYITCSKEAVWLLDQCLTDHSTILKHVLQIDQITVMFSLCKIVRIMKMDDSFFMSTNDLIWQKDTFPPCNTACSTLASRYSTWEQAAVAVYWNWQICMKPSVGSRFP